jgi:hypothetical protein
MLWGIRSRISWYKLYVVPISSLGSAEDLEPHGVEIILAVGWWLSRRGCHW